MRRRTMEPMLVILGVGGGLSFERFLSFCLFKYFHGIVIGLVNMEFMWIVVVDCGTEES